MDADTISNFLAITPGDPSFFSNAKPGILLDEILLSYINTIYDLNCKLLNGRI